MNDPCIVFIRHAQSEWNSQNRFTGWTDVGLSDQGVREATGAGRALKAANFVFDEAHTSILHRAEHTLDIVLAHMNNNDIPVYRSWRLNERHYGALQGLNKDEIRARYGNEQFVAWRRGYAPRPPALEADDPRHPRFDPLYADVPPEQLPATESLADTRARAVHYWQNTLIPRLLQGRRMLVSTHGNTLRGLVMHLAGLSETEVTSLEIPTGRPMIYTLSVDARPLEYRYLDLVPSD